MRWEGIRSLSLTHSVCAYVLLLIWLLFGGGRKEEGRGEAYLNIFLHMFAYAVQCVIEQLDRKDKAREKWKMCIVSRMDVGEYVKKVKE
jgi:hypothetical protein